MSENNKPQNEPVSAKGSASFVTKSRLVAAAIAIGGMIIGSFVGMGVQVGVESTGLLGPSVDALLQEQEANFGQINANLEDLKNKSTDPEVLKSLTDLGNLLARQGEIQERASTELAYLGNQVADFKQDSLNERGFAGGADFWLMVGESVAIGDRQHVFGVVRDWGNVVDVNLNGEKARLKVGDTVETDSCTVFFRQGIKRADGRVGFDVSCG